MRLENEDQAFMRFLARVVDNNQLTNADLGENMRYTYSSLPLTSSASHRAVQAAKEELGGKPSPQPPLGAGCGKDYAAYWLRLLDHPLHRLGLGLGRIGPKRNSRES